VSNRRGRGRLDNGLDAALWSPLRDVDPRVGEHLLDVLSAAGIAAYLEPSADVGEYTRSVFLPSPPSDRLFVDRARRREARGLVDQLITHESPHPTRPAHSADSPARPAARERTLRPDLDEDAEWAGIVAAFEAEAETEATTDRVVSREDLSAVDGPTQPLPPAPPPHEPAILDLPEEHYEPPPAPPVPLPAPASVYAVLLVAVGLLLIGAPQLLLMSQDVGLLFGITAVAGGVAMLVSRMRDRSEDDGDDGAVV
jgi:hypothetical protein